MLDVLIETLLALLNREVIEHAKNAHDYFRFFYSYCDRYQLSSITCDHLMSHDLLVLFIQFLIGKLPENAKLVSEATLKYPNKLLLWPVTLQMSLYKI